MGVPAVSITVIEAASGDAHAHVLSAHAVIAARERGR